MTLRHFTALAALILAFPAQAAVTKVRIEAGVIEGALQDSTGMRVFKGIPFAAPPMGDLRWRPPQPVAPWKGTRRTQNFSPRCIQPPTGGLQNADAADQPMDEDCLYLNVWSGADKGDKRPVLVWAHGGAFVLGSASLSQFDGERLASQGIVVVTHNYRLGPFGFFAHPELSRESGANASGNYALMDFDAVLRWVERNISEFGGDPKRVTIAGQSAGGVLVMFALTSGRVEGRFHRAILQSAPVRIQKNPGLAEAERTGAEAGRKLGATGIAALRAMSAQEILSGLPGARPNIDGVWIVEEPMTVIATGRHKPVDLLVGSNADEGTFPYVAARRIGLGFEAPAEFIAHARERWGEDADAFLKLYPATTGGEMKTSMHQAFADEVAWNERMIADSPAATGKRFLYYFSHTPTGSPPGRGATHTAEIRYVFGNAAPAWTDEDLQLSRTMSSYWVNFVTRGDPNGDGLPAWPREPAGKSVRAMPLGSAAAGSLDESRAVLFGRLFKRTFLETRTPAVSHDSAPASLVREGATEKLTEHVWAIPDGSAPLVPNVGIVVGKKAVLVIDTGMGARNAQTVLEEVAKVGAGKPIYLVTTHVHPEHDMGAHAFPKDSKLIRSKDQVEDIAAGAGMNLVPVFAQRSELNKELLADARHRAPDITFDREYTLDLGGLTAKVYAMGTNHTHGDTVVLVDGILFSGDVAMRPQPSFANPTATLGHWLASLRRLEAMKPTKIVPSHGPFGGREIIGGYEAYLTRIRIRTAQLKKAGKTQDEVVQLVTEEMQPQYPDKNRLAGAIRAGFNEAP
jgi:para-nitrobenzyl esterase